MTTGSSSIPAGAQLELYFEESNYGILVADPTDFRCSVIGLMDSTSGAISCIQREPASVVISNFAEISASSSFSILIYGVVKYQDSATSALSYSLRAVNDFLVVAQGTQSVARNTFQNGPDFVELLAITALSYETMETTDYTFQILL